jgi:hypothetical protein
MDCVFADIVTAALTVSVVPFALEQKGAAMLAEGP